jgi:hypothetical protein
MVSRPLMKDFANRTIRGILSGVLFGASTALGILVGATLVKTTQTFLRTHIPALLFVAVAGVSRFRLFTVVVAVSFLLLVAPKIVTFASRLYRSYPYRTRVIPIGPAVHKLLTDYLRSPVRLKHKAANVFVNDKGDAISRPTLVECFQRLRKRAKWPDLPPPL